MSVASPTFVSTALQLEKVLPNAQMLWQNDKNILWNRIKPKKLEISGRSMRIPLKILRGGNGGFLDPAGGAFGRGQTYTPDVAVLNSIYSRYNVEITAADIAATDGSDKAIENFLTDNVSQGLDGFTAFNETLLVGDGSGTLGAVISQVTGPPLVLTVANPSMFQDGQVVDVWSGLGGTNRGSLQITSVDFVGKTLTINPNASTKFGTVAPGSLTGGAVSNGDLLLANSAPGTAGSAILGIKYHQAARTTGTWLGLTVATYPGKLTTPYLSAASAPLSQGLVRLAEDKLRRGLGINAKEVDDFAWLMGLDMRAQWESLGTMISQNVINQISGDSSVDVLKKKPMSTAGGHEIIVSNRATPQRIDGLCLDHWVKGETQPMGPYNLDGRVAHVVYGSDGSVATALMYNWWTGYNIAIDNPLAGVYVDTIQAQTGY